MVEDIKFLKEKAKKFWKNALNLYSQKVYDIAAFNLDQTVQLFLKYLIAKKVGDWPKTHYLTNLVQELSKAYENKNILKFYQENELFFDNLENAYFTSRYYPKEFTENLVNQLIQNCKKFFEFLNKEIGEKFNEDLN